MIEHTFNRNIFSDDCEQIPIRKGFGEGLLIAGEQDETVVGLCADLTESTQMYLFRDKFPERFIEIGVAEQNLAAVASGMAAMGKTPFISSYAMFSPGRNWEQIRTTICYNDRKVIIVGSHAGVSVGPDGGTHQALEDIALMRILPHMTVLSPCDALEAKKATLAAARHSGPVYIRLAREKTPVVTTAETPFAIGALPVVWNSSQPEVAIFATGSLVARALRAARALESEGISVQVLNTHTIKPLDETAVIRCARNAGAVVSVEEHQRSGGLGSALAELLMEKFPLPMEYVAVRDVYGQSGTPEELIKYFNLDEGGIIQAVKTAISRK